MSRGFSARSSSSCIIRKKSFATELRNWRSTERLEVSWLWLPELSPLETEGLLLSKGRTPEVASIGELNGFWKYLEVAMRTSLSCAQIHRTMKRAIIAVTKSA
jgi:hypothetical protein